MSRSGKGLSKRERERREAQRSRSRDGAADVRSLVHGPRPKRGGRYF